MDLFISDLDGTLLSSNKELSLKSVHILNYLLDKGLPFSIASARSRASLRMLLPLRLRLPVILLNGVILYDWGKQQYLSVEEIPPAAFSEVIKVLKIYNKNAFVYTYPGNILSVYYTKLENVYEKRFYESRKNLKEYKQFYAVDDYAALLEKNNEPVVYITCIGERPVLEAICNQIQNIAGICYTFYHDIYYKDRYYLEIFSEKANKENGVRRLQKYVHEKACLRDMPRIVAFGDNLNDLPMMEYAWRAYAPANAKQPVLDKADGVLLSNDEDGIPSFLLDLYKKTSGFILPDIM